MQAANEGITLRYLKRASIKGGFGTQLGTFYDVLLAKSFARSGGAQFGVYKSTKVIDENFQFTQFIGTKFSTGEGFDINVFQTNNLVESNAQIIDQGFNLGILRQQTLAHSRIPSPFYA